MEVDLNEEKKLYSALHSRHDTQTCANYDNPVFNL